VSTVSIVILFITLIVFWLWSRRQYSRRGVLLTGLSDSGKTLIFARLLHSEFRQTHTSIKENVGNYSSENGSLQIVDVPGHERVRGQIFDKYKAGACGIVYVVDSATLQKDVRDDAEYLYNLLSDPVVIKNQPALLILCNKQDQPLAKSCVIIKSLLEKEINLVRKTKSSQLQSVDASQKNAAFLGKKDKDFEFSHLNTDVEIGEISAVDENDDTGSNLRRLTKWLENMV